MRLSDMYDAIPRTVLPLSVEDLDQLMATLERVAPALLPKARWLLLGPYAESRLLPPGFSRAPSIVEVEQLLSVLERNSLQRIPRIVQALSGHCKGRTEKALDHLESCPPDSWTHPAQELSRPWELKQMLALCQERLLLADDERRLLLESIATKLRQTITLEGKAAVRREKNKRQTSRKQRRRPKEPQKTLGPGGGAGSS